MSTINTSSTIKNIGWFPMDTCNININDMPFVGNLRDDLYFNFLMWLQDCKNQNYSGWCDG